MGFVSYAVTLEAQVYFFFPRTGYILMHIFKIHVQSEMTCISYDVVSGKHQNMMH